MGGEVCFPVNRMLVIDHHSTDKTISISEKYSALIFYEDSGFAYALNLGISLTETEVFAMVDSDDRSKIWKD